MTQRSKYYHEDAVRGMLIAATKGREKDVSKWIDPELTIRPEVSAFARAVEEMLRRIDDISNHSRKEATYTCPVCGSENVREENYKYLACPDCVAPRDEVVRAAIAYAEAAMVADSYVPPDGEKAKQIMYCVRSKVAAHKRLIEAVKKYKGE